MSDEEYLLSEASIGDGQAKHSFSDIFTPTIPKRTIDRDSGVMSMPSLRRDGASILTDSDRRKLSLGKPIEYEGRLGDKRSPMTTARSTPEKLGTEIEALKAQLEELTARGHALQGRTRAKSTWTSASESRTNSPKDEFPKVRFSDSPIASEIDRESRRPSNITVRKKKAHKEWPDLDYDDQEGDSDHSDDQRPVGRPSSKSVSVKAATYDGTSSWKDYLSHFEACSRINGWSTYQKGLYLAVSLRGQAQGILGDLPVSKQEHYPSLVSALEERFAPPNQNELYRIQLLERRQRASETLPELGQAIRRLVNLAYPTVPSDVRDTLAKQQFIEALVDSDSRLRIKQSRPLNLNDAIRLAVELEAYTKAEKHGREGRAHLRTSNIESLESINPVSMGKSEIENMLSGIREQLQSMQNDITRLKSVQKSKGSAARGSTSGKACYKCGETGHFRRDCPKLKSKKAESKEKPATGTANPVQACDSKLPAGVGISSAALEAGLYMNAEVLDVKVRFLVDTGATVTILSEEAFNRIPVERRPKLQPFKRDLMAANGMEVEVLGKGNFVIKPEGCKETAFELLVAKITIDGLLGLDFMHFKNCVVDLGRGRLTLSDERVDLRYEGSIGCFRVSATENMVIPPKSELILVGGINIPEGKKFVGDSLLVEGARTFLEADKALVARSLVKMEKKVPIRIMNLQDYPQTVYQGTTIAQASPVDVVETAEQFLSQKSTVGLRQDLQKLFDRSKEHLNTTERVKLTDLLQRYEKLFAESERDLGRTTVVKHKIETGDTRPIKQPLRRLPAHMREEVDRQVEDMLDRGVIQKSSSPWSSGVVLARKKDGSLRFCVDYRRLNAASHHDAYPLPRIDEALDSLSGCTWFSTLDLQAGYWQVELEPEDRKKTAFATRTGLYEFQVMPFGLTSAPATFERLMETILAGLQWQICLIYLDDIIVVGKTFEDMMRNLETVFDRLLAAGLKLKAKKCFLFGKEVLYLGHVVSEEGISTDKEKIEIVKQWPHPSNVKELRSFLGFCSYYRKFVRNFSGIAKCLHKLTEKGRKFEWTSDHQEAFESLKQCMVQAPVLAHPNFSQPFILDTDASNEAIGAVLSQNVNGVEKPIAYAGRTLTKAERKYCVTRKELLAVVYFTKYFKHYLYGKRFTVRTDHSSLRWLLNFKEPEGQMARWLQVLSSYDMDIQHRPGTKHQNADAISRIPCRQCGFNPTWEEDTKSTTRVAYSHIPHENIKNASGKEKSSLLEKQKKDLDISDVQAWVAEGKKPLFKHVRDRNIVVKTLWSQFESLVIQDDMLFRKNPHSGTLQAVVPATERRLVLSHAHDSRTSGHLGVKKTLAKIRQSYYWPGVGADVKNYVAGCEQCSKRKGPNKVKRAPMQICESGFPFERIGIDILCELPYTQKGNKHILVISDYYTKWTECFPMANMEAETCAKILVEEVISRFGVPYSIHSDQGVQFESALFLEMCRLLHIDKSRTTPYHPKSNGLVERFNKTLVTMLSAFVNKHQDDWDIQLPYVMMAYRSTEHETTKNSPNYMMLGRETSTPLDLQYAMPSNLRAVPQNLWAWELKERMEEAHQMVREYSKGAMLRQKRYHDQRLSWQNFKAGDSVYVFFPNVRTGTSHKLANRWHGPFKVVSKQSDVTYKVRCGRRGRVQVIHTDRMRKRHVQVLRGEDEKNASGLRDVQTQVEEHDFSEKGSNKIQSGEIEECDNSPLPWAWRESENEQLSNGETESQSSPLVNPRLPPRKRRPPKWHTEYSSDY